MMPAAEKDAASTCPDCGTEWEESMSEGCKRPWHHMTEWADIFPSEDDDLGCDHDWLDRPESDTHVCLMCGEENSGPPPGGDW